MSIAKRVVLDEEPSVLAVIATRALLHGEWNSERERLLPLASQPLDVLGMEDHVAKRRCPYGLHRETGIVERRLICVDRVPVRIQHYDGLGNGVDHAMEFLLAGPQLVFRRLAVFDLGVCAVQPDD